jgi:hypothetical protein
LTSCLALLVYHRTMRAGQTSSIRHLAQSTLAAAGLAKPKMTGQLSLIAWMVDS